jgi:hypothetical protein
MPTPDNASKRFYKINGGVKAHAQTAKLSCVAGLKTTRNELALRT